MQLIIFDIHRPGTATVTHLLNMMGVYLSIEGDKVNGEIKNSYQIWENKYIKELNNSTLSAVGANWFKIADFDVKKLPHEVTNEFKKKAANHILQLDSHRPWIINEMRLCLLFPLLRPLLEVPVCIHVNSQPTEVARYLRDANGFSIKFGMALWEKYTLSALSASDGLPRLFLSFDEMVRNPIETVNHLYTELCELGVLGLRNLSEKETKAFLDKNSHYLEQVGTLEESFINVYQKRLFEIIESKEFDQLDPPPSLSLEAVETMFQFEDKARVETSLKKKCVEFIEQREVLDGKERETKLLNSKIQEKEVIIQKNDRELIAVRSTLEAAKNQVAILKKEKETLESNLQEKDTSLAEKEKEIKELTTQNTKLQEDIYGRDDSLRSMKKELERSRSDFDQAKQKLDSCQDEMKRIKSQALVSKNQLKTSKKEMQSICERMEVTLQKSDMMQREIRRYEEIQRETDTTLRSRENYLKTVENSLDQKKRSAYRLTRWIERLDSDFKLLKKSKRWTVGNCAVRMLEIVLFRKRVPIAMDHIGEILEEFEDWRAPESKKKLSSGRLNS